MPNFNRYQKLDTYLVEQVTYRAAKLSRHKLLKGMDLEDIEQELMISCLVRLANYNKKRSGWKTFVDRMLHYKSLNLISSVLKKYYLHKPISLETWLTRRRSGDQHPDNYKTDFEREDLRLDLEKAVELISGKSLWLLLQLRVNTLSEIAEKWYLRRSVLFGDLAQLRMELKLLGLDKYLS